MAYQDPDNRPRNVFRRDDRSWNILPIALAALVVVFLAYLLFGSPPTNQPSTTAGKPEIQSPAPGTPPASKPSPDK